MNTNRFEMKKARLMADLKSQLGDDDAENSGLYLNLSEAAWANEHMTTEDDWDQWFIQSFGQEAAFDLEASIDQQMEDERQPTAEELAGVKLLREQLWQETEQLRKELSGMSEKLWRLHCLDQADGWLADASYPKNTKHDYDEQMSNADDWLNADYEGLWDHIEELEEELVWDKDNLRAWLEWTLEGFTEPTED